MKKEESSSLPHASADRAGQERSLSSVFLCDIKCETQDERSKDS